MLKEYVVATANTSTLEQEKNNFQQALWSLATFTPAVLESEIEGYTAEDANKITQAVAQLREDMENPTLLTMAHYEKWVTLLDIKSGHDAPGGGVKNLLEKLVAAAAAIVVRERIGSITTIETDIHSDALSKTLGLLEEVNFFYEHLPKFDSKKLNIAAITCAQTCWRVQANHLEFHRLNDAVDLSAFSQKLQHLQRLGEQVGISNIPTQLAAQLEKICASQLLHMQIECQKIIASQKSVLIEELRQVNKNVVYWQARNQFDEHQDAQIIKINLSEQEKSRDDIIAKLRLSLLASGADALAEKGEIVAAKGAVVRSLIALLLARSELTLPQKTAVGQDILALRSLLPPTQLNQIDIELHEAGFRDNFSLSEQHKQALKTKYNPKSIAAGELQKTVTARQEDLRTAISNLIVANRVAALSNEVVSQQQSFTLNGDVELWLVKRAKEAVKNLKQLAPNADPAQKQQLEQTWQDLKKAQRLVTLHRNIEQEKQHADYGRLQTLITAGVMLKGVKTDTDIGMLENEEYMKGIRQAIEQDPADSTTALINAVAPKGVLALTEKDIHNYAKHMATLLTGPNVTPLEQARLVLAIRQTVGKTLQIEEKSQQKRADNTLSPDLAAKLKTAVLFGVIRYHATEAMLVVKYQEKRLQQLSGSRIDPYDLVSGIGRITAMVSGFIKGVVVGAVVGALMPFKRTIETLFEYNVPKAASMLLTLPVSVIHSALSYGLAGAAIAGESTNAVRANESMRLDVTWFAKRIGVKPATIGLESADPKMLHTYRAVQQRQMAKEPLLALKQARKQIEKTRDEAISSELKKLRAGA